MTESPTEKLSFELWHHSARRCKSFPWGMSLAMFFLGLMASLGNLIINVGLESLAGTADVNYIMQLIPVIVMGALLAAFGWHTFKTVGKPVRDNFTELRGNGGGLGIPARRRMGKCPVGLCAGPKARIDIFIG